MHDKSFEHLVKSFIQSVADIVTGAGTLSHPSLWVNMLTI